LHVADTLGLLFYLKKRMDYFYLLALLGYEIFLNTGPLLLMEGARGRGKKGERIGEASYFAAEHGGI